MTFFRVVEKFDPALIGSRVELPFSQALDFALREQRFGEYCARFRGALLQLFGEPLILPHVEYLYLIEAQAESGHTQILSVYHDAYGPVICGDPCEPTVMRSAWQLRSLIELTQPANFQAQLRLQTSDSTVFYGCRNGMPYWYESSASSVPSLSGRLPLPHYQIS